MNLIEFSINCTPQPVSAPKRERILANPGFGEHLSDHMASVDYTDDGSGNYRWADARVEPYRPISMDPATAVLHYGQEIFEGLKAFAHPDGSVWVFRPTENARRFNRSAYRVALPSLPEEVFVQSLKELVSLDKEWVPTGEGQSLYLRPFMYASEKYLGVRPTREAAFKVISSPAGSYFNGLEPVKIWLSEKYARAGKGGTGEAKCGGNYAAAMRAQLEAAEHGCDQVVFTDPYNNHAVEELGGMNVFFVFRDNTLVTPSLEGTILEGITRSSIIKLARDQGFNVEERVITLEEWETGIRSGDIVEVFACGTAAAIAPIGQLVTSHGSFGDITRPAGELTGVLYRQLVGIQTGVLEDTHGWMYQLA